MNAERLAVYRRTLARAVSIAGSERRLAEFLDLKLASFLSWAEGRADPPFQVFLALIDIVASNALTPASLKNLRHMAPVR